MVKHWIFLAFMLDFYHFFPSVLMCVQCIQFVFGGKRVHAIFMVFEMIIKNSFLAAKSISILELRNCFWKCFLRYYFWKWHWVNPGAVWERELEMVIRNRLKQYSGDCKIDSNISLCFHSLLCQKFSS